MGELKNVSSAIVRYEHVALCIGTRAGSMGKIVEFGYLLIRSIIVNVHVLILGNVQQVLARGCRRHRRWQTRRSIAAGGKRLRLRASAAAPVQQDGRGEGKRQQCRI